MARGKGHKSNMTRAGTVGFMANGKTEAKQTLPVSRKSVNAVSASKPTDQY